MTSKLDITPFIPQESALHRRFYEGLPETLRQVHDESGVVAMVEPGHWRQQNVKVGRHIPPDAQGLASLMKGFCNEYRSARYSGHSRMIGLACAHHRFLWIHPFMDGIGRGYLSQERLALFCKFILETANAMSPSARTHL